MGCGSNWGLGEWRSHWSRSANEAPPQTNEACCTAHKMRHIQLQFGSKSWLETTLADIYNTGHPVEIYRFESRLGSAKLHNGYADHRTPQAGGQEPNGRVNGLRTYVVDKPQPHPPGSGLFVDPDFVREALAISEDPWPNGYVFFDIIKIQNRYYVLLTSALFSFGKPKVYMAAFADHRTRRLICAFQSRFQIVAN